MRRNETTSRGFSLHELGVVVGVIAIAATVVFITRGFLDQARISTAIQNVKAVREVARSYAERFNAGASFRGLQGADHAAGMNQLVAEDFMNRPRDPWGNADLTMRADGPPHERISILQCIGRTGQDALRDDYMLAVTPLCDAGGEVCPYHSGSTGPNGCFWVRVITR